MRRGVLVVPVTLLAAAPLLAQVSEEELRRREAEIFGAPAQPEAGEDEVVDDEEPVSEDVEQKREGIEATQEGPLEEGAARADPSADPGALSPDERRAREREAEIFGEPAPGARAAEPASPVQELVGDPPTGLDVIQELERSLDIGGRAFLALQYTFRERGAPVEHPLSSPSLLDLYVDARPSDRVRAYAEARLDYNFTVPEDGAASPLGFAQQRARLRLDQLWLKLDAGRVAFFTLGKQRIRWGTGRFWNPTDFLNQTRLDPLDVFDRRLGVSLAKVHIPLEDLGSNVYLIGSFDEADLLGSAGVAARIEALILNNEIAVSAALQQDRPLRFGVSTSSGLWLFDVRSEVAFLYGDERPFFDGPLDLELGVIPEEISRVDEWLIQAVFGGEISLLYSQEGSVTIGGEYFYNEAGTDEPSIYPLLLQRGAFQPLYVGRHYLAGYVALPGPGLYDDVNLVVSTIANLSDLSVITRFDASTVLLTFMTLNVWAAAHYGNEGELRFALDLPPTPGVPGLEEGVSVPAPVVDLGAALTMSF